jgi:hypothetical protein
MGAGLVSRPAQYDSRRERPMMGRSVVGLVALCLFAAPLRAQDLDKTAIAKALKAGAGNKFGSWTAECRAEASRADRRTAVGPIRPTGSYDVVVSTNLGAVAFMAYQARKAGKTLGVSDVPSWVLHAAVYLNRTGCSQLEGCSGLRPAGAEGLCDGARELYRKQVAGLPAALSDRA